MRTFPLTDTPSTWGAWDTRPRLSDMVDPDAEQEASKEWLEEEFLKAVSKCDATARASFAPQVRDTSDRDDPNAKRTQTVGEVIDTAIRYDDAFVEPMAQVLMLAAQGRDCKELAQRLMAGLAHMWAWQETVL